MLKWSSNDILQRVRSRYLLTADKMRMIFQNKKKKNPSFIEIWDLFLCLYVQYEIVKSLILKDFDCTAISVNGK